MPARQGDSGKLGGTTAMAASGSPYGSLQDKHHSLNTCQGMLTKRQFALPVTTLQAQLVRSC
jgi:hypothetical protein